MTARRPPKSRGWIGVLLCGASALGGPGAVGAARAQDAVAKDGPPGAPTAEGVVRQVADFYKRADSLAVEVERSQKVGEMAIPMTFTVAFRRPNRFAVAVRTKEGGGGPGVFGLTVVSDGKTMFTSIPALQKYTEAEAPASFDALPLQGDPIVAGLLQGLMIGELCAADPYAKLMEGVKSAKYAGLETIDGARVHHLTFSQDQVDWEMWVPAAGDPVVRRVVVDLSKALANIPGAERFKDRKMVISEDFKGWRIGADLDEAAFAFRPPPGSKKVASFFEGLFGGQQARSPLLGETAPDVDLKLLDGGDFRLKEHRGDRIVMLDFWATWCGPCVQEMPILAEVARAYQDKGVAFCAVNVREKPEEIRKFLEDKKLKVAVALDPEGAVGDAYHAEAIPMLVLVDKAGVVQTVHVGYDPAIKDTLRKELDDLIAGKDLAKESLREEKAQAASQTEGLEPSWTAGGPYTSVATDAKGRTIFALRPQGRCDVLDPDGKVTRTFRLPGDQHTIARVARLAGGSEGLLAFGPWGPSVLACGGDGTRLWEEAGGDGIDDVWAADLDGDGVDEAIVGYNGGTGLHAFSAGGKRLWKRTDLGNVWHVTAGDLDGDGKPEVVTTSAEGKVHVSSPADGRPVRTLDAGLYASMVRIAPGRPDPSVKGDVILVIGSGPSGEAMVALGGDGTIRWTLELPADVRHCDSLAVSPDGAWAAAGLRGGRVCVVDVRRGRIVAQAGGLGPTPMVAWSAPPGAATPLLLVATGREIRSFRVKPVATPPEDRHP